MAANGLCKGIIAVVVHPVVKLSTARMVFYFFLLLLSQSKILLIDHFRLVACCLLGTEVMLMLPFGRLLCGLLPWSLVSLW